MANETDRPTEPEDAVEVEGAAEKQAQSDLTTSVGERLERQESPSNKKLSTWKARIGLGRKSE